MHGEIHAADPSICRVSEASREAAIESVSRPTGTAGDTTAVEFTVSLLATVDDADEMFHHEQKTIYRVIHSFTEESRCACELIEDHGCLAHHLEADYGAIMLSFVAADLESFRDIVADPRSAFGGVSLRRLTQSEPDSATGPLVSVDHDELTAGQRGVLEMAREMGYSEHPHEANATGIAATLDINRSTFVERLSVAQSRLLDTILDV